MKKISCEVCGGTSIKKTGDGVFVCQGCGVQYSAEEIKRRLTELPEESYVTETNAAKFNVSYGVNYGDTEEHHEKQVDAATFEEVQVLFKNFLEFDKMRKKDYTKEIDDSIFSIADEAGNGLDIEIFKERDLSICYASIVDKKVYLYEGGAEHIGALDKDLYVFCNGNLLTDTDMQWNFLADMK